MNDPEVSIITPVYNYATFVNDCIESVKNQSFSDWEMIIVDDCSTDNSLLTAQNAAASDSRIRIISLPVNSGVSIARNAALKEARGRFIAFLDADDLWLKDKLKIQLEFHKSCKAVITYTNYFFFNDKSNKQIREIQAVDRLDYRAYLKNTIIGFSTAIIDRSLERDLHFSGLRSREDTQLWIRLLRKGHIAYGLPIALTLYRTSHSSLTSNRLKAAYQVWLLYYSVEQLGLFNSLYYFFFYSYNAVAKRIRARVYGFFTRYIVHE